MVGGWGFYDQSGAAERFFSAGASVGLSDPVAVMHDPAVRDLLGDVKGMRVADLGCGDARLGRWMIAGGCARYLGVDASARMLAAARKEVTDRAAEFVQAPIEQFELRDERFDLVVSFLALHYLESIALVLRRCRDALVPGGRMVFSVPHPVLTAPREVPSGPRTSWLVDDYFASGPRVREWLGGCVVWHHRTVETYVAALPAAGLSLISLRECPPVRAAFEGDAAELARRSRVPAFLVLEACRAQDAPARRTR